MKPLEAYFIRLITVIVATMPSGLLITITHNPLCTFREHSAEIAYTLYVKMPHLNLHYFGSGYDF